jgi:hypothetical protein
MRPTAKRTVLAVIAAAFVISTMFAISASAGVSVRFAYESDPVDVRVWVDRGDYYDDDNYYDDHDEGYYEESYDYDVYPSVNDVVLHVRPERSCYVTVYVVDTDGYLHVVHPLSPYDEAFLVGGRVYRFHLSDTDFYDGFDRGVAYAFAVSSPVPFSYSSYGLGIFGPHFGFQVYGDPYVASRMFYLSLIPARCAPRLVGIGYARFYVREYVRYPSYLCAGWHDYHGVRKYCRGGCSVYRHYQTHARDPYRVLRSRYHVKSGVSEFTKIARRVESRKHRDRNDRDLDGRRDRRDFDERDRVKRNRSSDTKRFARKATRETTRSNRTVKTVGKSSKRQIATKPTKRERVVRSSKNSFLKDKSKFAKMRRQLEKSRAQERTHKTRIDGSKRSQLTKKVLSDNRSSKNNVSKVTKKFKKVKNSKSKSNRAKVAKGTSGKSSSRQAKDTKARNSNRKDAQRKAKRAKR